MTLSVSTQAAPVGSKLAVETAAGATPSNNVTGAAGALYQIDVDNEANGDFAAFLKVYDNASPTVGTTAPDLIFKVGINRRINFVIPDGWLFTALSFAVVTLGGTAGSTPPTNPVIVKLVTT